MEHRVSIGELSFVRFLVPIVLGILFNTYFPYPVNPLPVCLVGTAVVAASFFIPAAKHYTYRWLYGAGISIILFGLVLVSCRYYEQRVAYDFPAGESVYVGVVSDLPQSKPRSLACNVQLLHPVNKKVVAYFSPSARSDSLHPGDKVVFTGTVQPFRNLGNPDDFDYASYMQMRGFSGSVFVADNKWMATGEQVSSLHIFSQQIRERILRFYDSLQLSDEQLALVSALTVGYRATLDDDLKQAFSSSGTSHILSVSGLHVGIIYIVISTLLFFLNGSRATRVFKQCLIILLLWLYAFVVGLPASVIRASTMLTLFCTANAIGKNVNGYNSLAVAAFFTLLFSPYSFFDVGFRMSFAAVVGILFFYPRLVHFYNPPNAVLRYVWQLSAVSISAQIGIFPIVLHYFGTFPTYFFIANLFVVPLTGCIMYVFVAVIMLAILRPLDLGFVDWLSSVAQSAVQFLIDAVVAIVRYVDGLPFSQVENMHISSVQMVLIFLFIFFLVRVIGGKRIHKAAIYALCTALLFAVTISYTLLTTPPPRLVVFNKPGSSDIGIYSNNRTIHHFGDSTGFIPHPTLRILHLSDNRYNGLNAVGESFPVDVLILSHDASFSLYQLQPLFVPGKIVLDSSLSRYVANRLRREGESLGLDVHDVSEMGAFGVDV